MKMGKLTFVSLVLAASVSAGTAQAFDSMRDVPARSIPLPTEASPEIQAMIAAGSAPIWNDHPKTTDEWKAWVNTSAQRAIKALPRLKESLGVVSEPGVIGGVKVYTVIPKDIPEENKNRLLINFHGGGYVLNPGEASTTEAILMAGLTHMKVVAVDYRMPPDFPYPAAMDDAMAVYKEIAKTTEPARVGVFGNSTGGAMTLAMVLRAKAEGLPLPGAISPGTPWSDLTETGDTYFANKGVDNVLVSHTGWLGDAAKLYANGHDPKDPQLSPVYGDFHGFPPTILTSGTRDLFLSNTVRVHRKMRDQGVNADLIVFEGLSHYQYLFNPTARETKEHFADMSAFFDKYLAK